MEMHCDDGNFRNSWLSHEAQIQTHMAVETICWRCRPRVKLVPHQLIGLGSELACYLSRVDSRHASAFAIMKYETACP